MINFYENDDPMALAREFCLKNSLDLLMAPVLAQSIIDNIAAESESEKSVHFESTKQYDNVYQRLFEDAEKKTLKLELLRKESEENQVLSSRSRRVNNHNGDTLYKKGVIKSEEMKYYYQNYYQVEGYDGKVTRRG